MLLTEALTNTTHPMTRMHEEIQVGKVEVFVDKNN